MALDAGEGALSVCALGCAQAAQGEEGRRIAAGVEWNSLCGASGEDEEVIQKLRGASMMWLGAKVRRLARCVHEAREGQSSLGRCPLELCLPSYHCVQELREAWQGTHAKTSS